MHRADTASAGPRREYDVQNKRMAARVQASVESRENDAGGPLFSCWLTLVFSPDPRACVLEPTVCPPPSSSAQGLISAVRSAETLGGESLNRRSRRA